MVFYGHNLIRRQVIVFFLFFFSLARSVSSRLHALCVCARLPYKSNFHTKLTFWFSLWDDSLICCRRHGRHSCRQQKLFSRLEGSMNCFMMPEPVMPVLSALNWCSSDFNIVCKLISANYDNRKECRTMHKNKIKRLYVVLFVADVGWIKVNWN